MKILHVVPTYIPAWRYGGPIHSVHGLCKALAAQGHEVHVFTTNVDGPGDSDVPLNTEVDIDGVKVWYFSCGRRVPAAKGFFNRIARRLYFSSRMKEELKTRMQGFDLVHLHSVFLWPTWAAAWAARSTQIPYVISPRGMLVKDLVKRKSRFLKSLWLSLIERRNIERAAAIHVTSETEADELKNFGYKLPLVCHVPNGVELPALWSIDKLSEDVRNVIEEGEYVLYLGRINWKKGLDRLIRAWVDVPDVKLVIAGNDEENYQSELQQLADENGSANRINFITRSVNGADKEALFDKANLFVLPSYSENFGITVLEAMVRGCPVVVTPEVGAAVIVRDAKAGNVVDGDGLAITVTDLLNDKQEMGVMSVKGKQWATKYYSWQVVGEKMMDCYEEITVKGNLCE